MTIQGDVHWQEGLFLQPQHLQWMQRSLATKTSAERRLSRPYPFGVIEAEMSADQLANGFVGFSKLRAVMPSGVMVDVPRTTDLPVVSIKKAFEAARGSLLVSLAVPLWSEVSGNAVVDTGNEEWQVKRIYKVVETEATDENTGENAQPINVRRINARLILEGDDTADMEVLPLARIKPGIGGDAGLFSQDSSFVPPCLTLTGSSFLRDELVGIANAAQAMSSNLHLQLAPSAFRGSEHERLLHVLRLRSLNSFGARLLSLVDAPAVTPHDVYLEMLSAWGELSALRPDLDPLDVPSYDHEQLGTCFLALIKALREAMKGSVRHRFIRAEFQLEGELLTLALTDEHLTAPTDYFLGLSTRLDPAELVSFVERGDRFKLMAPTTSKGKAVLGAQLAIEHAPPPSLPLQAGLHYFRIRHSEKDRMWQAIAKEKAMVIVAAQEDVADMSASLYMTVDDAEG
ncbi:MAG: type VI secretion system baseplate subunit TssK [Lentisphaerae bacterium]|nr:type VI secretion system baseplate subunit TssK [Lentisphaerota bacterium]